VRGVNPLVSLALELEQDYYANKKSPPQSGGVLKISP
jgi:hypothetical protein